MVDLLVQRLQLFRVRDQKRDELCRCSHALAVDLKMVVSSLFFIFYF